MVHDNGPKVPTFIGIMPWHSSLESSFLLLMVMPFIRNAISHLNKNNYCPVQFLGQLAFLEQRRDKFYRENSSMYVFELCLKSPKNRENFKLSLSVNHPHHLEWAMMKMKRDE